MKKWIDTYYYWFWFGWTKRDFLSKNRRFKAGISDTHEFLPNLESMNARLQEFVLEANENQAEIKAIIPLTGSQAETYSHADTWSSTIGNAGAGWGWGLGHGFGAASTGGFLAILQRTYEISDEDYAARAGAIQRKKYLAALESEAASLRSDIDKTKNELNQAIQDEKLTEEIEEKKKVIGSGAKFLCGGQTFKTHEEAEEYREVFRNARAEIESRLSSMQSRLTAVEGELRGG